MIIIGSFKFQEMLCKYSRFTAYFLLSTASLLDVQQLKEQREAFTVCGRRVAAWLEDQNVPSLFPDQANLVNEM